MTQEANIENTNSKENETVEETLEDTADTAEKDSTHVSHGGQFAGYAVRADGAKLNVNAAVTFGVFKQDGSNSVRGNVKGNVVNKTSQTQCRIM